MQIQSKYWFIQLAWMLSTPKTIAPQDILSSLVSLLVGLVYFAGIISVRKGL